MMRFLAIRLTAAVPVVIAVLVVSFLLLHIVPGDPITALVGDYPAPPDYVARIRHEFGLDEPLIVQFWRYVVSLAHGDFGFSFANQQPVLDLIFTRAGRTLVLMLPALVTSTLVGVLLALAASKRHGVMDAAVTCLSLVGYSTPVFWFGQVLIIVFAVDLHWLPAQGMASLRGVAPGIWPAFLDLVLHWILPGVALTVFYAAVVARVARASLREASRQDFVVTAQAKGLSDRQVLRRHILPNALIPIVTVIGYNLGNAITGSIMTEAVFGWPGLGGLFLSSITNRDYPVLQGVFIVTAVVVVLANLLTDLCYGLIDPRIRDGHIRQ
jgi:peptide/nickel transport system permease protein